MKALVSILLLLLFPLLSQAQEAGNTKAKSKRCAGGVCFTQDVEIGGEKIPFRGVGLFEYMFFDVYSAALYGPKGINSLEDLPESQPLYLVLQYHTGIKKADFIRSSKEMFAKNKQVDISLILDEAALLFENYSDVVEGDRYALLYRPGEGTTLLLNNKPQATFPSLAFRNAFFGIWLSRYSVDEALTCQLYGLKKC